jgi:hypothetical protein
LASGVMRHYLLGVAQRRAAALIADGKTVRFVPRPGGFLGIENTRRILRSAATCCKCREVKSEPLSV